VSFRAALVLPLALVSATGCAVVGDLLKLRRSLQIAEQYALVAGSVSLEQPNDGWLVVYVTTVPCDDDWRTLLEVVARGEPRAPREEWSEELAALGRRLVEKSKLVQHVVLEQPGAWYTSLAPGCYGVGAFADLDRDYSYDDEPVAMATASSDRLLELAAGDRRTGVELVIDPGARLDPGINPLAREVRGLTVRTHREQLLASIDQVAAAGKVASLSEARFGPEAGRQGYFDPFAYMWETGPGIYFLEPYDPDRIPVLFVHGATGYPQEFEYLIESLDRERYQAWFAAYPSGASLRGISTFFTQLLLRLRLQRDFAELAIVAHSMGGLLSRSIILEHHEQVRRDPIRVFVTLSTPWAGIDSAQKGVQRSPVVVPSWRDVAPGSDFLRDLFFSDPEGSVRRHLPEDLSHHLLFGLEDRTIPSLSLARWEALRDADERWPLASDHTGILKSPEAARLLGEILGRELP
jgi:pimeloyl-ACP methyl ester carboxylesterase